MESIMQRLDDLEKMLFLKPNRNAIFADKDPNFKHQPKFNDVNLVTADEVTTMTGDFITESAVNTLVEDFVTLSTVNNLISEIPSSSGSVIPYGYFYNDGYSPQTCASGNYVYFGSLLNHDDSTVMQDTLSRIKATAAGTYLLNYTIFYDAAAASVLSFATDDGTNPPEVIGGSDNITGITTQIGSNLIATFQVVLNLDSNDGVQVKNVGTTLTIKKCQLTVLKLA
jgi:hypothetical protein